MYIVVKNNVEISVITAFAFVSNSNSICLLVHSESNCPFKVKVKRTEHVPANICWQSNHSDILNKVRFKQSEMDMVI